MLESQHQSVELAPLSIAAEPSRVVPLPAEPVELPRPRLGAAQINRRVRLANWLFSGLCLMPFVALIARFLTDTLGPNPVETITVVTGSWALKLLWLTLLVTPLRKVTGWQWLPRLRRVPALFSFFYASLHLSTYLLFDHEFNVITVIQDVLFRPYIAVGLACFVMMVPLAITSTDAMMRRLGGRRWKNLHRLTYLAAIAAATHYLLLVKRDINAPGTYIIVLALLLYARVGIKTWRLPEWFRRLG